MASETKNLVTCYNKGCGQKFDPDNNPDDACRFHPGVPYFHDAYKGWTCCNKKSVDFTEFLSYPGCTQGKHSNEKPVEPTKPEEKQILPDEVIVVKPNSGPQLVRPAYDTPLITLNPILASSVKQMISSNVKSTADSTNESDGVAIGTPCKNSGCKVAYEDEATNSTTCVYHPGCPIFHEGLKYWSCCQKKTTDFQTFLNQEGCAKGSHLWNKDEINKENVECRWDWHQTGNHVVISIYAKEYCPKTSWIKINPIRVNVQLVFPNQGNSTFNLDIETRGVIDIESCKATMYGTKVEISLKKAELIKWEKLEIPRKIENVEKSNKVENITPQVDALDLDDL